MRRSLSESKDFVRMTEISRIFDLLTLYREKYKDIPDLFNEKTAGKWYHYTSSEYLNYSRQIAMGLIAMGVGKGDRISTILVNGPHWNFFDMGILMTGAISVPIYPTISEENFRYIFTDAKIDYLIVSDRILYNRFCKILPELTSLKGIFSVDDIRGIASWKEIIDLGKGCDPLLLERSMAAVLPDDLATIIYTSGTTGRPKGVMLSHRNFVSNFKAFAEIPPLKRNDRVLSFLPLCHVYERMAGYVYQYFGVRIFYVRDIEQIAEYMREVRPHGFAAVPRVFEKIYNNLVRKGRSLPFPVRMLFFWALRQGHKFELNHARGRIYDVKLLVANVLVFSWWRRMMGGRLKFIVSGGASLHPKLTRLFWAARIPVLDAYGLTETSPGITCYRFEPDGMRFGTVGPLLSGVRLKIAEDGEILVKGPNVMLGYLNRPEKNEEVFDAEGWFHTGDIGILEDGKFLKITDRKKEIFKTSGGKYVAPQPIEQRIRESPFIEHIMVVGENRNYVAALIVPNFDYLKSWCAVKHIAYGSKSKAIHNSRIIRRIRQEVERFNQDLGQFEKIKKFRIIDAEWSTESGEISPTLKPCRKFIIEKYQDLIEETYRSDEYDYRAG